MRDPDSRTVHLQLYDLADYIDWANVIPSFFVEIFVRSIAVGKLKQNYVRHNEKIIQGAGNKSKVELSAYQSSLHLQRSQRTNIAREMH